MQKYILNCGRHILIRTPNELFRKQNVSFMRLHRNIGSFGATPKYSMPMKSGTPIPGLDIYKDKDPLVVLARSEYPEWISNLSKPLPTLAELRRMPESEATDKECMRYLKLTRRLKIKNHHAEMAASKR